MNSFTFLKYQNQNITGSSSRPIVLVKIEKESCFKSQELTSDSIVKAESVEEYLRLLAQSTASDTLLKAKVFPNPASEEVTIVLPIAVDQCKVELMDSRGYYNACRNFLWSNSLSNCKWFF